MANQHFPGSQTQGGKSPSTPESANTKESENKQTYSSPTHYATSSAFSSGVKTSIVSTVSHSDAANQRVHESSQGYTLHNTASQQFKSGLKESVGRIQNMYSQQDDTGAQSVGGVIGAGVVGYSVFRGAQELSPTLIKAAKGVYNVGGTTVKAAQTVSGVYGAYNSGLVKNGADVLSQFKVSAHMSGFDKTQFSKSIVKHTKRIQHRVSIMRYGKNATKKLVTRDVKKASLMAFRFNGKLAWNGFKMSGKGALKTLKGGVLTATNTAAESEDIGVATMGNSVLALKNTSKGIVHSTKATYKVIKTGVKVGIKTGKNTIGAGRKIYKGAKFLKNNGMRAAWNFGRKSLRTKMAKAGGSAINAAMNALKGLIKKLGAKLVIPLLLIVAIVLGMTTSLNAPIDAVGALFGQVFSIFGGDGSSSTKDYDIREYLTESDRIPTWRATFVNDLSNKCTGYSKSFNRVNLTIDGKPTGYTTANISTVLYSQDNLTNIIQPIFNSVIIMDYNLEPTSSQANEAAHNMFNTLFKTTESTITKITTIDTTIITTNAVKTTTTKTTIKTTDSATNQTTSSTTSNTKTEKLANVSYTINDADKSVSIMPINTGSGIRDYKYRLSTDGGNTWGDWSTAVTGSRTSKASLNCDSNAKNVIQTAVEDNTGNTAMINSDIFYVSSGSRMVDNITTTYTFVYSSHNNGNKEPTTTTTTTTTTDTTKNVAVTMDGIFTLLNKYYLNPIDELSNKNPRSAAEEQKLKDLQDYYNLTQDYISEVNASYGGSLDNSALSGVQWVNGTRANHTEIVNLAKQQIGQSGGQPYWSWYGFKGRVEWCACFVSWVYAHTGHPDVKYSGCLGGIENFKEKGRWEKGGFTNLVAGDVIFFDWDGDGLADHTGIVAGRDDKYVYTVEGNSGDAVKNRKYPLNSSVIFGYGLIQ